METFRSNMRVCGKKFREGHGTGPPSRRIQSSLCMQMWFWQCSPQHEAAVLTLTIRDHSTYQLTRHRVICDGRLLQDWLNRKRKRPLKTPSEYEGSG